MSIRASKIIRVGTLAVALTGCSGGAGGTETDASSSGGSSSGASASEGTAGTTTGMTTGSTGATSGGTSGGMSSGGETSGSSGGVELEPFSFFVTSLKAMQELSDDPLGFGGDLRFGEVGPGAGLRGADKICAAIAESSMPGSSVKEWRAFLSVTADAEGKQVNAIDRIGEGPWYDRLGRLVAMTRADLVHDRPLGADPAIVNDLPNEWGIPNRRPDPNLPEEDNHHMLTGSTMQGTLFGPKETCLDWTSAMGDRDLEGRPQVGLAFPRPGGMESMAKNWMSALLESGCAPGVNLIEMGPPQPDQTTVGSGGGYGGFYCFALSP